MSSYAAVLIDTVPSIHRAEVPSVEVVSEHDELAGRHEEVYLVPKRAGEV